MKMKMKIKWQRFILKFNNSWGQYAQLFKPILCGNNPIGNFFYPLWRNIDCDCCAFFKGFTISFFITLFIMLCFF